MQGFSAENISGIEHDKHEGSEEEDAEYFVFHVLIVTQATHRCKRILLKICVRKCLFGSILAEDFALKGLLMRHPSSI